MYPNANITCKFFLYCLKNVYMKNIYILLVEYIHMYVVFNIFIYVLCCTRFGLFFILLFSYFFLFFTKMLYSKNAKMVNIFQPTKASI